MTEQLWNKVQQITEQNLIDLENYKKDNGKVIGFYCLYAPTELAVWQQMLFLCLCAAPETILFLLQKRLCPEICVPSSRAVLDLPQPTHVPISASRT